MNSPDQKVRYLRSIKSGNISYLKSALDTSPALKSDPNVRHPLGWTALHVAAVNGKHDVLRELLKVESFSIPYFL